MRYLILINSKNLNPNVLNKTGLIFRPILDKEYTEIVEYLNNLVTDEMIEKILSISKSNEDDTFLNYQIALTLDDKKISFIQNQFLKLIIKTGSKKEAIQEFVDFKNAVICETNDNFYKYFEDAEAIPLINSIITFINFTCVADTNKKRLDLTFSLDDFLKGNINYSLSFYTNNLYGINCELLTKFIGVLDSYSAEYQFYFLNNIMNFFFEEEFISPTKVVLDDISFIEFLLINENDDKKKYFVLKCGILCRGMFDDDTNEKIKLRFEGLYEIRSHLIHGSTQLLSRLESKYGPCLELIENVERPTFRGRQTNLLISAGIYLDLYLVKIFNKFILENDLFKFLKDN